MLILGPRAADLLVTRCARFRAIHAALQRWNVGGRNEALLGATPIPTSGLLLPDGSGCAPLEFWGKSGEKMGVVSLGAGGVKTLLFLDDKASRQVVETGR